MFQRAAPKGGSVTAADTNAHALPTEGCLYVFFSTPASNTGSISVSDAAGVVSNSLTGGITIPKGTTLAHPIGPITGLSQLAYQAQDAGDVLNYLVVG